MADIIAETVQNITEPAVSQKAPITQTEYVFVYICVSVLVLIPILIGSRRSVKSVDDRLNVELINGWKEAIKVPIMMTGLMCFLYWNISSQKAKEKHEETSGETVDLEWFDMLCSHLNLTNLLRLYLIYDSITHLYEFVASFMSYYVAVPFCCSIGYWYLVSKHWLANNILGMTISANVLEFLQLNAVTTGCVLLGGILICDVLLVFGADVMVTLAKSLDAPIKLMFPVDILRNGVFAGEKFAFIGLGDIVFPGFFMALLLRFDASRDPKSQLFFKSGLLGYVAGLASTFTVGHVFNHAQPAMLYLVPLTIGAPVMVAFVKRELSSLLAYKEIKVDVIELTEKEMCAIDKEESESSGEESREEDLAEDAGDHDKKSKKDK